MLQLPLPQFLISPNAFADSLSNKYNNFERGCSHFDQKNLDLDYFYVDWPNILNLDEKNVELETKNFLAAMNSGQSKYVLLRKVSISLKRPCHINGTGKWCFPCLNT